MMKITPHEHKRVNNKNEKYVHSGCMREIDKIRDSHKI